VRVVGNRRLPPEIREIVERNGIHDSYWWSSRGAAKLPSVGDGVDEMTNLVPCGCIKATAGATSEEPIRSNGGVDFQGDDFLSVTAESTVSKVTHAYFGTPAQNANDEAAVINHHDGGTAFASIEVVDLSRVRALVRTDAGNGPTFFGAEDSTVPQSFVLTVDGDAGSTSFVYKSATSEVTQTETFTAGTFTGDRAFGRRVGSARFLTGELSEVATFDGLALSVDEATSLALRLWERGHA